MYTNNNFKPLLTNQSLYTLSTEACTSTNLSIKQKAVHTLAELYLDGTLTPTYLYQYMINQQMEMNNWQISCFALLEIMHNNTPALEETQLLQFSQCLGKIIKQFYHSPNTYLRIKQINHVEKKNIIQQLKPFMRNSLKRTFGQLIKYLLLTKIPVQQCFSVSYLFPNSNKCFSAMNESEKIEVYFAIQISLAVIQKVAEYDEKIGFMQSRSLNYKFQATIINQLLIVLPAVISRLDTEIQLFQLVDTLDNSLSIKQLHYNFNKLQLSQIQLPLRLIQSILYFPYNFKVDYMNSNNQLFAHQKEPETVEYPSDIAVIITSKQFISSLFEIANKFITYIVKQIQTHTLNKTKNNTHLQEYIKYYKITMKYISQVCKIKISKLFISVTEQSMTHQDSSYDQYYSQILISTVVIQIIRMYHQSVQSIANRIDNDSALCTDIILSIAESITGVLFSLINNVQFPTLLQQSRQYKQSSLSVQQIYKELLSILFKLTQYNVNYHHNLTLALYYNIFHYHNDTNIEQENKCGLKMLFIIWQHILFQKNNILIKLIINDKQHCENQFPIKTSQNNKYVQQIICTVTDIVVLFIKKILSQNQSILVEDPNIKTTNIEKSSQLSHELLQFFKLITTIIQTQVHSAITVILTCINNHVIRLKQMWDIEIDNIVNCLEGCQNLDITNQQIQLKGEYGNLRIIENQISNAMLMCRNLMIDLSDVQLINGINNSSNSINRGTSHKKATNAVIEHLSQSISQQLQQLAAMYINAQPSLQKEPNVDQSIIIYTSQHVLYLIVSMRQQQSHCKRQLRNTMQIMKEENKNINDDDDNKIAEIKQWLIQNSITGTTCHNCIFADLSILVQLVYKSTANILKTIEITKNMNIANNSTIFQNTKIQLNINTSLAIQILTQCSKIGKAYKTAHFEFVQILRNVQDELNQIPKNKGIKPEQPGNKLFLNGDENINFNMGKESLRIIYYRIMENIQKSLRILTSNKFRNIEEQQMEFLLNINKEAIQVLTFILLHHELRQKVQHLQLTENFEVLFKILRVSQIKQLKQNKVLNSDTISTSCMLQLSISTLTGILSTLLKSKPQQKSISFLFLSSLDKQIPINELMSMYIIVGNSYNSQQFKIRKISKLLQLHRVILQNLRIITSQKKAWLSFEYQFIGTCFTFWSNSLQYVMNYDQFLEQSIEVLINMSQILKKLVTKNLENTFNNINFYLLQKQFGSDFQDYMIKNLSVYVKVFKYASQSTNILTCYKQLNNVVNSTLTSICINILQYIFEYNTLTHQTSDQHIKLLKPFTSIFIEKMKIFIGQSKQLIKGGHNPILHNDHESKFGTQKWYQLPIEKIGYVEQQLNMIKIVLAYVNRAKLYEHNKGLQNNITYFMTKIHNTIANNREYDGSDPSPKQNPPQLTLQFSFFSQLIKLALVMVSRSTTNTIAVNHICLILSNLSGIFNHYNTINHLQNDHWGNEAKSIVEMVGVDKLMVENFVLIWKQCYSEQIHYDQEKNFFFKWFDQCIKRQNQNYGL